MPHQIANRQAPVLVKETGLDGAQGEKGLGGLDWPNISMNVWESLATQRLAVADAVYPRSPASQLKQTRTLIHRELNDALCAVSRMRRRLNALAHAVALPLELLLRIFLMVAEGVSLSTRELSRSWISVTYVCRTWRSVALNCAQLWTRVPFSLGRSWTRVFLLRSKRVRLNLTDVFYRDYPVTPWKLSVIKDNMAHASTLDFTGTPENLPDIIAHMTGNTHALRTLVLNNADVYDFPSLGDAVTVQEAPLLCDLSLDRVTVSWSNIPWSNLRSLSITKLAHPPSTSGFPEFLSAISTALCLEELHLGVEDCPFAETGVSLDTRHTVDIPRLRLFSVKGYVADCQALVASIRIPPTSSLAMHMKCDDRESVQPSLLGPLLAAHTGSGSDPHVDPAMAMFATSNEYRQRVRIQTWQRNVEMTGLDSEENPPHVDLRIDGMRSSTVLIDDLLALCLQVNVASLRTIHIDLSGIPSVWEEAVWHELLVNAHAADTVKISGPSSYHFLKALSKPPETEKQGGALTGTTPAVRAHLPNEQHGVASNNQMLQPPNTMLLPNLCTLYLAEFIDLDLVQLFDSLGVRGGRKSESRREKTEYLEGMLQRRWEFAPLETLYLEECSIPSIKTVWKLNEFEDLIVEWDGSTGKYAQLDYDE